MGQEHQETRREDTCAGIRGPHPEACMVKVPNSTSSSVPGRFTHLDMGSQLHHRINHSQWTQAPSARTVFLSAREISSLVLQLWGTYMAEKSQDFLQLGHKPGLACVSTCAALPSAFCVPALPPGGPGPHHPSMLPHTEILPVFIFFPNTQTSYIKLAGTSRLQPVRRLYAAQESYECRPTQF